MPLRSTPDIVELNTRLLIISFVLFTLLSVVSLYVTNHVVAQLSENTSSPAAAGLPTIQITSHEDGQEVPSGELTIQGISSDNEQTNCQVYADVNDNTPMRNVTADGPSGQENDFSAWIFTYTQDYQLIEQGENELTAKISCFDNRELNPLPAGADTSSFSSPLSKWHTVNVTAVQGADEGPLSSSPLSLPFSSDEISDDTIGDINDDGSNEDSTDDDDFFEGDSFFE